MQATFENIGIEYVVAPDAPLGLVDFVVPASVIAVTQEPPGQSHLIHPCQNALKVSGVPASLEALGLDAHAR